MTNNEILAVVTAHKEGKKIECKIKKPDEEWTEIINPRWNFEVLDYRVKREPRVIYVNEYDKDGTLHAHNDKSVAISLSSELLVTRKAVKYIEVIED